MRLVAILLWRASRVELWSVPDDLELPSQVYEDEVAAELAKEVEKKGRLVALFAVDYWLRR